jgi:hypothetical protein
MHPCLQLVDDISLALHDKAKATTNTYCTLHPALVRLCATEDLAEYQVIRFEVLELFGRHCTAVDEYGKAIDQIKVDDLVKLVIVTGIVEEEKAKKAIEDEMEAQKACYQKFMKNAGLIREGVNYEQEIVLWLRLKNKVEKRRKAT